MCAAVDADVLPLLRKNISNSNCLCPMLCRVVRSFVRFGKKTTGSDVDNDENDRKKKQPRENKMRKKELKECRCRRQRVDGNDCCVGNISSIDKRENRRTRQWVGNKKKRNAIDSHRAITDSSIER